MTPPEENLESQRLEEHLHRLVPADPSPSLTERVFAAFDTPADAAPTALDNVIPIPSATSWFQPIAAAAAVAVVAGIVAIIGLSRPGPISVASGKQDAPTSNSSPATDRLVPASAQNIYEGSKVDGIVLTEDRLPVQAVRHQFTDTYTWKNPADGSLVELRVPVERVRYVPVPTD